MSDEKKTRLGRGLSSLLGDLTFAEIENKTDEINNEKYEIKYSEVDISQIFPNPNQPRKTFNEEELQELSESISQNGVLQPIIVQQEGENYTIVAGERRYRASVMAGLKQVPCIVQNFDERQTLIVSMLENIQRSNFSPIEEAQGYKTLCDKFSLSQNDVAKMLGKSRSHVSNMINLLSMPKEIQEMTQRGEISSSHAKVLKSLNGKQSKKLAQKVAKEGLSVRELEDIVKNSKPEKTVEVEIKEETDFHNIAMQNYSKEWETIPQEVLDMEDLFNSQFKQMMHIQHQIDETGKIVIHYADLDELREIMAKLVDISEVYAK